VSMVSEVGDHDGDVWRSKKDLEYWPSK